MKRSSCVIEVSSSGDEFEFSNELYQVLAFGLRKYWRRCSSRRAAYVIDESNSEIMKRIIRSLCVFVVKDVTAE